MCHSHQKETIVEKWGIVMEKDLPACPVETTLMLTSDRWKVLIIRDLLEGTKRSGELKGSVGNVSQKVSTADLRSMEASGLPTRKVYPEVPPRGTLQQAFTDGIINDDRWMQMLRVRDQLVHDYERVCGRKDHSPTGPKN